MDRRLLKQFFLIICSQTWIIMIWILLISAQAFSQRLSPQMRLDSLLAVNQKIQRNDSTKVKILLELSRQYINMNNTDKVEEFTDKVIDLAHKIDQKKFSATAYYRRAAFYHGNSNHQKAEENYLMAINEYAAVNNLDRVGGTYIDLGKLYASIPDYAKALEANQKALAIYEKTNNERDRARCYTNISDIYQDLGQQSQALVYLKMALKLFNKKDERSSEVALVYHMIGRNYLEASAAELAKMNVRSSDKLRLALDHFSKSLKTAEALEDRKIVASNMRSIGNVYNELGSKEFALNSYLKSVDLSKKEDDKDEYAASLYALGNFYREEGDFGNAIVLLNNSLRVAQDNNALDLERNSALALSDIYEKERDYNKSLFFYKKYINVRDRIFNEDKEKEVTRRQMQLDFGVKERDFLLHQRLTDGELQRQVLLAQRQQQELILKKQQLALSDKERSLQRLTFLKKQADLEIEREIQAGKFERAKMQARYETSLRDKQISKQEQQIKFDWKIKIFLTIAITLILLAALLIFFNQRKTNRLNKIINHQKRELEQLSRVKDRIFSAVSHDMRVPINSLISFIQLLEAGNIEQEKLNRYAASLKHNLAYTSTMMENLLNWAASQMQGFNPYLEQIDVSALLKEIQQALQSAADEKGVNIHNQMAEHIYGKTDSNMLSLVLRNLVSNAIKFTPQGGNINITANEADNRLQIKIADTGLGLTAKQINHFNHVGHLGAGVTTLGTNREKGTGLGLLLCRTFVGLMDGKITVESNSPQGSVFIIELSKES